MNIQELMQTYQDTMKEVTCRNEKMNALLQMVVSCYGLNDAVNCAMYRQMAHDELDMLLDARLRVIVLTDQLSRAQGGEE